MTDALAPEIRAAVETLWDYHRMNHVLEPADIILVFGSSDLRVAAHAAELWHEGYAPRILFSGGRGRMTQAWADTEAAAMGKIAREAGVPEGRIILEEMASNTGENIRFSRELLESHGLLPRTAIVVQKPYMERRTHAALEVQWPELSCIAASPDMEFADYCSETLPPDLVISAVTGDFQRVLEYPAMGFASEQPVPPEAMAAYERLVKAGYVSQLR
ncbi:YdcF family protein [Luteolibacter sp. GHJ8]|uniref:YdcF family protein n=1 Tax=Luteolibacter rhizosphaerae TaxID=2989719 RepID=A0ABT3G7W0_9BACT|nr:YdcF family protein [Luteolibacter rhizosphaerae]MCW1915925.1 YdcF family protein [Luteolibacter rhizosphaerae]